LANLQDADLTAADLWEANLWEANLTEADLTEANLKDANLFKANFKGAYLEGTNLKGTILSDEFPQIASSLLTSTVNSGASKRTLSKASECSEDTSNQGVKFKPDWEIFHWKGLRFRSPAEIKIAEALDRAGVLYLPNCMARLNTPEGRKNKEADFLVCCETKRGFKWGIIEVDGRYHTAYRRVEEQQRERVFEHSGVRVYRFDAKRCHDQPDNVVREFIELLDKA
jgi:hypothetical protein